MKSFQQTSFSASHSTKIKESPTKNSSPWQFLVTFFGMGWKRDPLLRGYISDLQPIRGWSSGHDLNHLCPSNDFWCFFFGASSFIMEMFSIVFQIPFLLTWDLGWFQATDFFRVVKTFFFRCPKDRAAHQRQLPRMRGVNFPHHNVGGGGLNRHFVRDFFLGGQQFWRCSQKNWVSD